MKRERTPKQKTIDLFLRIVAGVLLAVAVGIVVWTLLYQKRSRLPGLMDPSANYVVTKEMPVIALDDIAAETDEETWHRADEEYGQYIFVGDSRFVGMERNKQSNDVFIAEVGEGYYYLCQHLAEIQAEITTDTAVIIGMGVNDLGNLEKYVRKVNEMAGSMNCQICFLTVNPVDESQTKQHGYNITNEAIDHFNEVMMEQLAINVRVIDSNSYLWNTGFDSPDGIHYSAETNKAIYQYIKETL